VQREQQTERQPTTMKKTKTLLLLILAEAIVIASCTKKDVKTIAPVISVKTMKVSANSHLIGKSYMGTIEEEDGANVSFDVTGNVKKVFVDEDQFVSKGQVMAEVNGENVRST
jgi:multidrug efflux pump subunit AcrA (membrane-fusion protein)